MSPSLATRTFAVVLALVLVGSALAGATAATDVTATVDDSLDSGTTGERTNDGTSDPDDTDGTTDLEESENESDADLELDGTTDDLDGGETDEEDGAETVEETTDSIDGTADDLEETVDETNETVNETVDDLDGTIDDADDAVNETVEEVDDAVDETVNETIDDLDGTTGDANDAVNETIEGVDDAVNGTTETLEESTDDLDERSDGDDDRAGPLADANDWFAETATDASADLRTAIDALDAVAPIANVEKGTASDSTAGDEDDEGGVGAPAGTGTATDAVLVGLLGAATAAGAGASGASGAAGASGAGGALSGWRLWLRSFERLLRRAAGFLPWKLLSILKYSRYDDSDPLENERRAAVYETVAAEPGCYLSQLSEESGVALSTVRHHVRILEEEDLIASVKANGKRRYYLEADDAEVRATLEEPAKRAVLEALADLGRVPNGRLAEELDRDPSTVSHHLSALAEDGLVRRERDGRATVNELAPEAKAVLNPDLVEPDVESGPRSERPPERRLPADD